ncbi:MAG: PilN domain-containing protein [Phycisphaerales bacterium]|nr:PilN domain-containing protein [Phycisphaerales bacterium]
MKHPFDDFIPPSWHKQRADSRVIRIGIVLVALVSISTVSAFASTLSGWHNILKDRGSVASRWDDASERVHAYVKVQKDIQDAIDEVTAISSLGNSAPRSLLLWELTQTLPTDTRLDDIRFETRKRSTEEETELTETVMLLGVAPDDASISSYIDALSGVAYFANVSLMYAQLDTAGERRNFSIQLQVGDTMQVATGDSE